MSLGEKIRRAREAIDLTQKAVAEVIGVDIAEVICWEDDKNIPEGNIRKLLSALFNTEIDIDRKLLEEEISYIASSKLDTGQLEEILSYLKAVEQGIRYGVVLSFQQCPSCDFITKEDLTRLSTPCPNCGKKNETRHIWPQLKLLNLIDSVYFFSQLKNKKFKNISIILFCSLFEALLEDFLETFMKKQGNSSEIITLLLNCYKNIEARTDVLYKKLTGESFKEDLESVNFKGWYENWKEIKDIRNNLLHVKQIYYVKEDILEKTKHNSKGLTTIFAELNNRYCLKN